MTDSIAFRGRRHKAAVSTRPQTDPLFLTYPTISFTNPVKDTLMGGNSMSIFGTNFVPGMTVTFGGTSAVSVTYVNATQLNVIIPSHYQLGPTILRVARPDGLAVETTFIYEDPEMLNGLRLTVSTGNPIPASDVASASTIYMTPYTSARIALYNATSSYWAMYTISSDISLALTGLVAGRPYDVFVYDNAGTPTLELTAWTNDSTRSIALARQDGVLVRTSAPTRRYVGTIKTIATNATTDTQAQRFVYNQYNQVERDVLWVELTDAWTYTSTTIRGRGGLATARVEFVMGQPGMFQAEINVDGQGTTSAGNAGIVGIGLDTTASFAAGSYCCSGFADTGESSWAATRLYRCSYAAMQTVGYHAAYWVERVVTGSQTVTMYGDHGLTAGQGLSSHLRGKLYL